MDETSRSSKQQRHPEKWIVNESKLKRKSGKAYVSRQTKKEVPTRDPCICKQKCFIKLGMEVINQIFHNFWDTGDYNM